VVCVLGFGGRTVEQGILYAGGSCRPHMLLPHRNDFFFFIVDEKGYARKKEVIATNVMNISMPRIIVQMFACAISGGVNESDVAPYH
jgi:hypothetical protein